MNTSRLLLREFSRIQGCQLPCRPYAKQTQQTPAEYCLHLIRYNDIMLDVIFYIIWWSRSLLFIRKHDYENYLCTLLLPPETRSSVIAIRAFNTETALVRDQVGEAKLGLMRLKFWENCLNLIYEGKPPRNPSSLELDRVSFRVDAPRTCKPFRWTSLAKHHFCTTSYCSLSMNHWAKPIFLFKKKMKWLF